MSADYKAPPREDKPTSGGSAYDPNKPLAGSVFYLDLPSNRITDTLEINIKDLGGVSQNNCFLLLGLYAQYTEYCFYCTIIFSSSLPLRFCLHLIVSQLFMQFLSNILF